MISTPLVHLGKKETPVSCCLTEVYKKHSVPRAGIEPAHLAVLVFETNASTYSAIWAYLLLLLFVDQPGLEPGTSRL